MKNNNRNEKSKQQQQHQVGIKTYDWSATQNQTHIHTKRMNEWNIARLWSTRQWKWRSSLGQNCDEKQIKNEEYKKEEETDFFFLKQ